MLVKTSDANLLEHMEWLCFGDKAYPSKTLQEIIQSHICLLIYNKENIAVGYIILLEAGSELELIKIGVIYEHRHLGFAKQTILEVLNIYKKNIVLEVSINNLSAIDLYKTCGFELIGRRKAYYANGDDAIVMKLTLNKI